MKIHLQAQEIKPKFEGDRNGALAAWKVFFFPPSFVFFSSAYFFYPDTLEQHIGWASLCCPDDGREKERPVITTFLGLSLRQAGLCLKSRTLWVAVTL